MKIKIAASLSLFLLAPTLMSVAPAQAKNLTLTGVIVGRRNAGEVWLRSYDRYYRVAGRSPFAVKNGDRIRVSGAWKNGILSGSSWKSLAKRAAKITPNRSINGAVYRDLPGDEFQVKSHGGAIYRVLAYGGQPKTLNRGDVVRVLGKVSGGVLLGSEVIITAQRNALTPAPDYQPHRAIVGTVSNNPKGNIFEIKNGGRSDRVLALYGEPNNMKAGSRVRIWAFWDAEQGLWQASNLRVLSGQVKTIGTAPGVTKPYGPDYRPPFIYATVVAKNGAMWTVRSGKTNYPIQLLVARPALFTIGSKVKLTGSWRGGKMLVKKIEKWNG